MNICLLTHTFPKYPDDTTAAFMHPLVLGMKAAGDNVTVLTPFHPELRPSSFPYPVVAYKYIWPDSLHMLGYSQTLRGGMHLRIVSYLLAPFLVIAGIMALTRLTKRRKFDVVSVHWVIPNGVIASVVCKLRHIPFMVTLPGSDVYIAQQNTFFSRITRWAVQDAARVCADSPQYLRELKKIGAQMQKPIVMPYPVDVSVIRMRSSTRSVKKALSITQDAPIIVSVGRLIEKKGFHYVIHALPQILRKFPKTRYIIVGDGDMRDTLEKEAIKAGVIDHIHFVGNITRQDIGGFYSLADVIVVPSIKDREGNIDDRPVALIEAMACGRAVVVSKLPGNANTVEHGKSGILVPPKDPQAIAGAVISLLESRRSRNRLGRQARRVVAQRFRHTVIGRAYHDLFVTVGSRHYA